MLQWAQEHGCPWDEDLCGAAGGGNLRELQTDLQTARGMTTRVAPPRGDEVVELDASARNGEA